MWQFYTVDPFRCQQDPCLFKTLCKITCVRTQHIIMCFHCESTTIHNIFPYGERGKKKLTKGIAMVVLSKWIKISNSNTCFTKIKNRFAFGNSFVSFRQTCLSKWNAKLPIFAKFYSNTLTLCIKIFGVQIKVGWVYKNIYIWKRDFTEMRWKAPVIQTTWALLIQNHCLLAITNFTYVNIFY